MTPLGRGARVWVIGLGAFGRVIDLLCDTQGAVVAYRVRLDRDEEVGVFAWAVAPAPGALCQCALVEGNA